MTAPRFAALGSPLWFEGGALWLLDQRRLPTEEVWCRLSNVGSVAAAIRDMLVRGAPAIGCAAAWGLALGALGGEDFDASLAALAATRPTAVNLFWALERMRRVAPRSAAALCAEAAAITREDLAACRAIGEHGAPLLPEGTVLTHCNAGALATAGYGTALGVIRSAVAAGRRLRVFCDETRPYLQGARLTAWELDQSGIDVTLITDGMAGHLMARGEVQSVIVGADRIARNGDTANKIGTYGVAVLARAHGIPFFVAAPRTTFDRGMADGAAIPIEERAAIEVTHLGGVRVAADVKVRNPSFDVTPARLIDAIITDAGVARPPFSASLPSLLGEQKG